MKFALLRIPFQKLTKKNVSISTLFKVCIFLVCAMQMSNAQTERKEIVISGARFTADLLNHWIKEYGSIHPEVTFTIENKGAAEYSDADIIIHGHRPAENDRNYFVFAKYAVLPIAHAGSPFADYYGNRGLKKSEVKQTFFYNPLDRIGEKPLQVPFNAYARIQKASAPMVFAETFGYEQKDLHGRLISGTDQHLIQAILRDTLGVTFAPLSLLYDYATGLPNEGIVIIPIDADDNGKINDEEKSYQTLATTLEFLASKKHKNLPISDIIFSTKKIDQNTEANKFITWVLSSGLNSLNAFGYLTPDSSSVVKKSENNNNSNK